MHVCVCVLFFFLSTIAIVQRWQAYFLENFHSEVALVMKGNSKKINKNV